MMDLFKVGWRSLQRRRLRSLLTMLGVFIGVATIVTLIALGQGLEDSIEQQFAEIGTDKVFVQPRGSQGGADATGSTAKLTEKDLDVVRRTAGVESAGGGLIRVVKVEYNDETRFVGMFTIPPDSEGEKLTYEAFGIDPYEGRVLDSNDGKKVMVGFGQRQGDVFSKEVKVRDSITINDEKFKVVGIMDTFGNNQDDKSVLLTEEVAQDLLGVGDTLDNVFAKVESTQDPAVVAERIKKDLRKSRGLKEGKEDFTVTTATDFLDTVNNVLNIVQIFLFGIASISLVVGGIGIVNTMYTAVIERTQEIGVMKAMGARNKDITTIFLFESGVLGFTGGLIGIIIGVGFAKIVEHGLAASGNSFLQASVSPMLIILTLFFSFAFGAAAGTFPAMQASKLKVTDALRYE